MAIKKGELISKINYVNDFNAQVWDSIYNTIGRALYTNNGSGGTTGDGVYYNGIPRFGATSYYGSNSLTGTVKDSNPRAVPEGHISSLSSANAHLKITADDITTEDGYVTAEKIYNACFQVLKAVTHVRPFKSYWVHTVQGTSKRSGINMSFANDFRYAYFRDTFTNPSNTGKQEGFGTWGGGGSLSYWLIEQGCTWASLQITENSVLRSTMFTGNIIKAADTASVITNFWRTWSENCKNTNAFTYRYYSCHLNCHSNCHTNHSNRSRR